VTHYNDLNLDKIDNEDKKELSSRFNAGSIIDIIWYSVLIFIISLALVKYFLFQQVTVIGDSMQNNFATGQNLIVQQVVTKYHRGDVIALYADANTGCHVNVLDKFAPKFLLKRIIGLPGESVEIIGSQVIIYNSENPTGLKLKEDYVSTPHKILEDKRGYNFPKTKISNNSYFVLGDNRPDSVDSRILGEFQKCAIMGKVIYRIWPLGSFSKI
jgi:signal peptidase I